MSDAFAGLPKPPYCAVICASRRAAQDAAGYGERAQCLDELAQQQPGYLGVEPARGGEGLGITVANRESGAAIMAWRQHLEHAAIRERGRSDWHEPYELRVAEFERAYGWSQA